MTLEALHSRLNAAMDGGWLRWSAAGCGDADSAIGAAANPSGRPAAAPDLLFATAAAAPSAMDASQRRPAVVGLLAREADPRAFPADEKIALDAPSEGIRRAADRALRAAGARAELNRRLRSARKAGLAVAAPHPPNAPRVTYLGGAHPHLLALERRLTAEGVAFEAALTPVSMIERLTSHATDVVLIDARPGHDRAAMIVRTLQRGSKTRGVSAFVLDEAIASDLDRAVMQADGIGVWTFAQSAQPCVTAWVVDALARRRARLHCASIVGAVNDAAMMQSMRRDAFRDAYVSACLSETPRTSVIAAAVRPAAGGMVRVNDVVSMARRLVRNTDCVLWRPPWGVLIVAADCGPDAGACIMERLRNVGASLGATLGRIVHVRAPQGAPLGAVSARLDALFHDKASA